jgi:hypothetical protein
MDYDFEDIKFETFLGETLFRSRSLINGTIDNTISKRGIVSKSGKISVSGSVINFASTPMHAWF